MDILPEISVIIGPLVASFVLGFTTLLLLIWYSSKKQTYWKKKGVPYVKPYPIVGSLWENMKKPLQDTEMERYNKYGRIYGHYEGNTPVLSVGEPKILRQIMVKDFQAFTGRRILKTNDEILDSNLGNLQGEDWKRVRTIMTPIFTTGKLKKMMSIFKDCSRTLVKNFREAAEKDEPIEVKRIYGAFTMDVIASSAFSTKIDSHNDPNNAFVTTAREFTSTFLNWRFILFALFPGIMKLFRISIFSPKGFNFFKDATLKIIEERKTTGQVRNDFLQLMLDTAKEASEEGKLDLADKDTGDIIENYGKDENEQVFKNAYAKKSLSVNELVAQCTLFFLAGYEPIASNLSFATYLLALHPDVQEELLKEIDDALRENGGELTYEALQSMKYLDNVISESLRLYPPAFRLERAADVDYELGDTGITVPKGMIVTVPTYAMHRDPKLFPDPEKFDPNRFNPEERIKQDPYSFMPFGSGPRNCIGMRFALMEVKVCLAHVLSNFRVKKCAQTKVPLDFRIGVSTVLQPKDITVQMEIRKDYVKSL